MPVHKVQGGYQWGSHGKVYASKEKAEAQGRAAYANGYKGDQGAGAKALTDAIQNFQPKHPRDK